MEEFIVNGTYCVSNSGGYEIQISNCGSMARMRDAYGSENPTISDWYEIESVIVEDSDDDIILVIDPEGYNIDLCQVMCVHYLDSL